ncbi:hypothetical protein MMC06_005720 [Schaereria dolodes]|nr:hypothetical protein [Schaereria dolodes]
MSDRKMNNIVVLGGSYAGLSIAHKLLKDIIPSLPRDKPFRVTLVTESTHFYWTVGAPRAMLGGEKFPLSASLIPIQDGFKQYPSSQIEIMYGTVKRVDPGRRQISIAQPNNPAFTEINYDTLVVTTGSTSNSALYSLKGGHQQTEKAIMDLQARLPKAKSVLIAGGGPAGTETAAEMGFKFAGKRPNAKQITLLSGSRQLLTNLRPDIGQEAQRLLKALGVEVRHNLKVKHAEATGDGKMTVHLSDSSSITVDIYIDATGRTPNTAFMPTEMLDSQNKLVVDEFLHVKGAGDRVYAFGDVASTSKSGAVDINFMTPTLVSSISSDLGKKAPLKAYVRMEKDMQLVPIGPNKGVGVAFGWKLPSFFVWIMKGRTYWMDKAPKTVMGTA